MKRWFKGKNLILFLVGVVLFLAAVGLFIFLSISNSPQTTVTTVIKSTPTEQNTPLAADPTETSFSTPCYSFEAPGNTTLNTTPSTGHEYYSEDYVLLPASSKTDQCVTYIAPKSSTATDQAYIYIAPEYTAGSTISEIMATTKTNLSGTNTVSDVKTLTTKKGYQAGSLTYTPFSAKNGDRFMVYVIINNNTATQVNGQTVLEYELSTYIGTSKNTVPGQAKAIQQLLDNFTID